MMSLPQSSIAVAVMHDNMAVAVRIAGEFQAADDPMPMQGAIAQFVFLDLVFDLQRQVRVRQQVSAMILRALEQTRSQQVQTGGGRPQRSQICWLATGGWVCV